MMEHSPLCWKHDLFCQTLSKVTNSNLYNKSIRFYVEEQPQLLNDMLKVIAPKVDLSTTVAELRKLGVLYLAVPFLKSVQSNNNFDVNEALNEIYVEEEDPESLKNSILEFSSFDQIPLAKKIENHPLLEFRRISALVYRANKKYNESIEISKKLEFYKDAIDSALESQKPELVDELLRFFAKMGDKESFAACLYTCYEFVKPDVAMELAWRHNMMEFVMPFMIQTVRDLTKRMDHMQMKADIKDEKEKKEKEEQSNQGLNMDMMMNSNSLMVYQGGMGMNSNQGMGMNPNMNMGMNNMNMGMNNMNMGMNPNMNMGMGNMGMGGMM
jgi:clathrin heavy chain